MRATWTGISGDRWYKNGPSWRLDLVDNSWLRVNVIANHGPLGALYPELEYIMEGDTPSFIGLIERGLGSSVSPSYGGWGGRYVYEKPAAEPRAIWTNNNQTSRDAVTTADGVTATSDQATVWRWREHYQLDFQARMDWCIADSFAKANHNPVAIINGDSSEGVLQIAAKGGSSIKLDAAGSSDPDANAINVSWWIYREAGTLEATAALSATTGQSTEVQIPAVTTGGTLHVIMQVEDTGAPHLSSYLRAVLNVAP